MISRIPTLFKFILNFLAYVGYTLLVSIIFSLLFPIFLIIIGKDILNPVDPIFGKIQIVIALLVLVITFFYRKYFYIELDSDTYVVDGKDLDKDKKYEKDVNIFNIDIDKDDKKDENIKIYVDKEINGKD